MIGTGRKKKSAEKRCRYKFVKEIRDRFGETQQEFGKRFGVGRRQIGRYELGLEEPCYENKVVFDFLRDNKQVCLGTVSVGS